MNGLIINGTGLLDLSLPRRWELSGGEVAMLLWCCYLRLAPVLFSVLLGELSLLACYELLCYCWEDPTSPLNTVLLRPLQLSMLGGLVSHMGK